MSLFKKLSAALAACLFSTGVLLGTPTAISSETALGISSFTVYNEGMIRQYYNKDSKISAISYMNPNGYQYATQDWYYDEHGTVGEKQLRENIGFLGRYSNFQYKYSSLNLVNEEIQTVGLWSTRKLKYHYNLFNSIDSVRAYTGSFFPTAQERVSMRYTAEGRLEARTYYHANGSVAIHDEWDYDFQGRVIAKRLYNSSMNLVNTVVTEYNVSPGTDLETTLDSYGSALSFAYNYFDQAGRLYERQLRDSFNNLVEVCSYEYSWSGQLAKVVDRDASAYVLGSITTSFDGLDRPYLHTFKFVDNGLAVERIKPYLQLPGNDL